MLIVPRILSSFEAARLTMKRVHITSTRNTTYDAIKARRHNIWMGISLGNKYFNKDHLARYISWAVSYTREKFLMIVADEIHAINYEVFEHAPPDKALAKALRKGDEMCATITEIMSTLSPVDVTKVEIVRWKTIRELPWYTPALAKVEQLATTDRDFAEVMLDIVRINLGERAYGLSDTELRSLSRYVILEFPTFLGPIHYRDTMYDLNIYPGLSLLDDIILAMQDKLFFRELFEEVPPDERLAIAEVFAA